jgi:hypothetical protein
MLSARMLLYSGITGGVMSFKITTLLPCCRAFDWGGDARWQFHQRNLEVTDPRMLQRAQARFFKREIVSVWQQFQTLPEMPSLDGAQSAQWGRHAGSQ